MARKYTGIADKSRGGAIVSPPRSKLEPELEHVTAIDLRDVEPLVGAASELLKEIGRFADESEHLGRAVNVSWGPLFTARDSLASVLKAFEEQPAGVGAGVGKPQGPGAGEVAPPRLHTPSADSDGNQQPQGGDGR